MRAIYYKMHNINIHMYVLWSESRYCCLDKDHTHSRRESRSKNMPQAQTISACNKQNHYGLHPGQGRGATENDRYH